MKRIVFMILVVVVAFNAAAVNRLYLPDFAISPGETMQVALIMQNDEQITAIQTDLMLPEGLTVVQEDDEYLFDLTSRKASDHAIISKLRHDGVIRRVSFSIGVKPFKGNNGAVVVINLKAADDFEGSATIGLKNSIIANLEGQEFFLAGDSCEVQFLTQQLLGDANGDGKVNINDVTCIINYLLAGCQTSFHIENADLTSDGLITIADVTALINYLLQSH